MIYFYSGTPGSGKSLHVAQDIVRKLRRKKKNNVICNFPVNLDLIKRKRIGKGVYELGNFTYKDNLQLTPHFLIQYAFDNHEMGVEGQTLVVIDECQVIFNPREFNRSDRMDWIKFFTVHRHLGYNFMLVSQFDRLVDRQIRALFEYEVKHRKVNNFKIGRLLPFALFVAVERWYGVNEKTSVDFFTYRKKFGKLYNSYRSYEDIQMIFPSFKFEDKEDKKDDDIENVNDKIIYF